MCVVIWYPNGQYWMFCYAVLFSLKRLYVSLQNKSHPHSRGEYNVYSTFQTHKEEFDYLKSLEMEEKINKIRWLPNKRCLFSAVYKWWELFFFLKWLFDLGFYF